MSQATSILRPLLFHRWTSLSVMAGAATATAVLAGALIVGDSVRGSLRDLTLERLGGIDQALVAQRFVRTELLAAVAADAEVDAVVDHAAPAILLRGSVEHAERRTRATQVGVQGIDDAFLQTFADGKPADASQFFPAAGGPFPPTVINTSLATALGAAVGDQILLHLKRWAEVPRSSLLGRKDTSEVVETMRLEVTRVIDDSGIGRFGLASSQAQPLLAFVRRAELADALDQPGEVNAMLVSARGDMDAAGALGNAIDRHLTAADIGLNLRIEQPEGEAAVGILESDELVLRPGLVRGAGTALQAAGLEGRPVLAYLANAITLAADPSRSIPYSTVVAIDAAVPGRAGKSGLRLADGTPAPRLGDGEILLNAWAAADLGIETSTATGAEIRLDYFTVGAREELVETSTTLRLAGIVAMAGLGAAESLVQEVPGIAGSENMADWDPPFPVELDRVRQRDEDYWDRWRDTPKAFVGLETGRALWQTRWGDTTSLRVALPATSPPDALAGVSRDIAAHLPRESVGLVFRSVKADGLTASAGATDFSGLFLGFSLFLIVSAALLAALLFRLGVEQRAGEIGLLLAVGFAERRVRSRLLAEGTVLAASGAVVGIAGAILYAGTVMLLLRTWWLPAVGTTALRLHIQPLTLVLGALAAVLVVVLSILRTVRRSARVAPVALLRGVVETAERTADGRPTRRSRIASLVLIGIAGGLLVFAFATGRTQDPGLFFTIGPLVLCGGLTAIASFRSRAGAAVRPGPGATLRLGLANAGRSRGRSLLATGLVAVATFMIVTVAAFEHDYSRESLDRTSGAGGFALVAESEVPLLYDPSTEDGRFELGLPTAGRRGELLDHASIVPCRLLPGDDTSCLNLYRPTSPRVLGLPPALVEREAFRFTATFEPVPDGTSPWTLLDRSFDDGAVPAIGDAASMQYILKLPLGGDLVLDDQQGGTITLRLVATLATSIFQSEMLVSEASFLRRFPLEEGFRYFLVDTSSGQAAETSETLEAGLSPYGFDAVSARDKLASFHAVQNTYLSTFRTLGGLGLLLGTVGLAVVMLRNIAERRAELAAMRAFGFRRRWLSRMVVAENALLLVGGLVLGTASALITVSPQLRSDGANVPWTAIAVTLSIILTVGLAATFAVAAGALRVPLLSALKTDH